MCSLRACIAAGLMALEKGGFHAAKGFVIAMGRVGDEMCGQGHLAWVKCSSACPAPHLPWLKGKQDR